MNFLGPDLTGFKLTVMAVCHVRELCMNSGFPGAAAAMKIVLLIVVSTTQVAHAADADKVTPAVATSGSASTLTAENAATQLAATKSELEAIGSSPVEGSVEARIRTALQRRVAIFEEFIRMTQAAGAFGAQETGLSDREKLLRVELESAAAAPVEQIPDGPVDKDELDGLEQELQTARDRSGVLREAQSRARQRLDSGIRQDLEATQKRGQEAAKRADILNGQLSTSTDDMERRLLTLQSTNARFDAQVAEEVASALKAESSYERAAELVNGLELELADLKTSRLDKRFGELAAKLQESLADEKARAAAELAQKERREQQADTPHEKFLAKWGTELARSQSSTGDVAALIIPLKKDVAEQEKRLATEREEDATIRDLVKRAGTAGGAGERINRTAAQLQRRKRVVERTLSLGQLRALPTLRERRFQVEDLLIGLTERFNESKDELATSLEGNPKTAFTSAADDLLPKLRPALRAERLSLSEAIELGTALQKLLGQRLALQRDLERFIRTRAFWLRDGKPIGPATLAPLAVETGKFKAWLAELGSTKTFETLTHELTGATAVFYGILLFPIAPILLFWARQKLRHVTRRINDHVVADGQSAGLLLTTMLTGFMSAALIPLYFVLAARLVGLANLPPRIAPVLMSGLNYLALFLFCWFLFRSFFHRRGIAEVQFGMPKAAANSFYSGARWFLFGALIWLAPARILRDAPFSFEALPTLAYTVFLIAATIAVASWVRRGSAFVEHRLATLNGAWPSQQWGFASLVFIVLMVSTVVLQLFGYRTASITILMATLLSLATLIALPPLYAVCVALLNRVRSRQGSSTMSEVTGEKTESMDALALRTRRFVRFLFIALAVVLIASIWGVDQQALATLDELHVYTVRGVGDAVEFVSAGDLVRCVLVVIVTVWVLRAVPGVYEFAVFPRLNVDEGVKYALLTITRYSIFVIGLLVALGHAHLDLGRLGWLMAAVGVGLGFGLQEIVSNFVSGLILLIERPVRPGDVVSVGSITGTVQRINIRATTIVNFDRQEVLVPNRSLITSEVTNWTRGDTTNRVVVPIGVAYGSDVEQVMELLQNIANEAPEALKNPAPQVFFMNHGESSLDFEVRLFVPSPSELMRVRNYVNKAINREFAAQQIEIPFPQRDLHIRSGLHASVEPAQATSR